MSDEIHRTSDSSGRSDRALPPPRVAISQYPRQRCRNFAHHGSPRSVPCPGRVGDVSFEACLAQPLRRLPSFPSAPVRPTGDEHAFAARLRVLAGMGHAPVLIPALDEDQMRQLGTELGDHPHSHDGTLRKSSIKAGSFGKARTVLSSHSTDCRLKLSPQCEMISVVVRRRIAHIKGSAAQAEQKCAPTS